MVDHMAEKLDGSRVANLAFQMEKWKAELMDSATVVPRDTKAAANWAGLTAWQTADMLEF